MQAFCVSQLCFFAVGGNLMAAKHTTRFNEVCLRVALVDETGHAELVMRVPFFVVLIYLEKKIINCFQMNVCGPAAGLVAVFSVKEQEKPERANRAIYCFRGLNISAMNQDKGLLLSAQLYNYRL